MAVRSRGWRRTITVESQKDGTVIRLDESVPSLRQIGLHQRYGRSNLVHCRSEGSVHQDGDFVEDSLGHLQPVETDKRIGIM